MAERVFNFAGTNVTASALGSAGGSSQYMDVKANTTAATPLVDILEIKISGFDCASLDWITPALAAAHVKLKEDSDKHLADNMAKLNEETAKHQDAVEGFKKQMVQLQALNKQQQDNAGSVLSDLNSKIGAARKELQELQEMQVRHESISVRPVLVPKIYANLP